jgi:hypothetical protein
MFYVNLTGLFFIIIEVTHSSASHHLYVYRIMIFYFQYHPIV